MLNLTPAELDALAGSPRLGVFFRLDTSPVVRLWQGIGDCDAGINVADPAGGGIYKGFGELTGVPALQQLLNGVAERVSFRISGVSAAALEMAAGEAAGVRNRAVQLGIALFGRDWQMLGAVKWIFRGRADVITLDAKQADSGGFVRTIELSVGSRFTGRRRGGLSYYTDHDQQQRSPGDRFCERTALHADYEKIWPKFPQVLIQRDDDNGNDTIAFESVPSWVSIGMKVTNEIEPTRMPANTTVSAKSADLVTVNTVPTGKKNDLIAFWQA